VGLLNSTDGGSGLERIVELAHRHLGFDSVAVCELRGEELYVRATWPSAGTFGTELDRPYAADGSYSRMLVTGQIPGLIPDTSANPLVARLATTTARAVASFIGVPLLHSDGSVFGTLSGASHQPQHGFGERDLRFLEMLADLLQPELDERARKAGLRTELGRILETEDAAVAYQPIVEVDTRRCLGIEALARFPKPFSRPDETFAAAYEVGLGYELERLIVSKAWPLLDELAAGQFLTVNLTPEALLRMTIPAREASDLPLDQLVVEMTENSVVESYDILRTELEPLRRRGLRVCIDDTGAGYATLRHVVELRPDMIKIDRSLIEGVADDNARRVAVRALVGVARDLDALVVAEGVERGADFSMLADLGVHAAQGFYLQKPTTNRHLVSRWLRVGSDREGSGAGGYRFGGSVRA
jgi:EAL domain-containing protein (putative c-di-GMP-specific phosphodiesterase class I)